MADAAVTLSGDLMCFSCAVEVERQEQEVDPVDPNTDDGGDWEG